MYKIKSIKVRQSKENFYAIIIIGIEYHFSNTFLEADKVKIPKWALISIRIFKNSKKFYLVNKTTNNVSEKSNSS